MWTKALALPRVRLTTCTRRTALGSTPPRLARSAPPQLPPTGVPHRLKKKTPLGSPQVPRHKATAGSCDEAFSDEEGTPVRVDELGVERGKQSRHKWHRRTALGNPPPRLARSAQPRLPPTGVPRPSQNTHPPRITIIPWAHDDCRVLGGRCFL